MNKKTVSNKDFANQFLKSHQDDHFNFEESAEEYQVSSGSLYLDHELNGGFRSGLLRFVGANEGGKTNAALHVMLQMLNSVDNSKGLYIKAEGRLSHEVRERSGLKFVYHPDDWDVGTCLVFECNIYDTVFDFIRGLLRNNSEKNKYCIILDSMDGMLPKAEVDKTTGEAAKVAAGALLSSDFLKRVSLGMSKFGHLCILISQIRSTIKASQYTPSDPNNQTNASGSNASLHYPDWILEFMKRGRDELIVEKKGEKPSQTNPILGHLAKVKICKSTNETSGKIVTYPIKYGRTGGKSIWIEREIIDILLMWGFLEKKGSWFSWDEEVQKFLSEHEYDLSGKTQGMESFYKLLYDDEKLTSLLKQFIQSRILK